MNINAPKNIINLLQVVTDNFKNILKDDLTGIYLHGSLAMNCFNPETSDIDFLVVTNSPVSIAKRREIADMLIQLTPKATPKGFEMSIITRDALISLEYPMPYEFHFGSSCVERYKDPNADLRTDGKTDSDLAAHLTIIKARGITLFGKTIDEIIPNIPSKDYLDSISGDAREILENMSSNPVYNVLNLCRVWAYIKDGLITSKAEGGEWAMKSASEAQKAIISQALDEYRNGITKDWDNNALSQFGDELFQILEF